MFLFGLVIIHTSMSRHSFSQQDNNHLYKYPLYTCDTDNQRESKSGAFDWRSSTYWNTFIGRHHKDRCKLFGTTCITNRYNDILVNGLQIHYILVTNKYIISLEKKCSNLKLILYLSDRQWFVCIYWVCLTPTFDTRVMLYQLV